MVGERMVLSKLRKEVGKVKMNATVEVQRLANINWILDNRADLTDNYPNRWLAVENESVQIVDVELFIIFKIMDQRRSSPATIFYLCNDYEIPVLLTMPREVWRNDSE